MSFHRFLLNKSIDKNNISICVIDTDNDSVMVNAHKVYDALQKRGHIVEFYIHEFRTLPSISHRDPSLQALKRPSETIVRDLREIREYTGSFFDVLVLNVSRPENVPISEIWDLVAGYSPGHILDVFAIAEISPYPSDDREFFRYQIMTIFASVKTGMVIVDEEVLELKKTHGIYRVLVHITLRKDALMSCGNGLPIRAGTVVGILSSPPISRSRYSDPMDVS